MQQLHLSLLLLSILAISLRERERAKFCNGLTDMRCRLFKVNPKGSVPAIKELDSDRWIVDSGEFVDYLEDKYPEPKLGKADSAPQA